MTSLNRILCCLAAAALLAACDRNPTPQQARDGLEKRDVEVSPQSLIKETRSDDSQNARDMVRAGIDPNAKTAKGWTALMSAAYNGQADTVKLLIEKGADVNAEARGYTALAAAVYSGNPDIVRMLLRAGADPNRGQQSPLAAARGTGNKDMIKLLTGAGAKG